MSTSQRIRRFVALKVQSCIGRRFCSKAGFLGLPALKLASDFPLLSATAIKNCITLRKEISNEADPRRTLLLMDQISNEICSVIDVAEFCRNTHEDENFREQAEDSFSTLSSFIHGLNADTSLYTKLRNIVDDDLIFAKLPTEYQIFAKDLKAEFESDGIHLKVQDRERAVILQGNVVAAETKFMQNASKDGTDDNTNFMIGPFPEETEFRRFHSWLGQYVHQPADLPGSYVLCNANRRVAGALLKSVDSESIRKTIWNNMMSEPSSNKEALGQLIKSRQELAEQLGFKSFGHKFLVNKIVKSPEGIQEFLSNIADTIRPQAQKELEVLLTLKHDLQKADHNYNSGNSSKLQPWDVAYLTNVAMSNESGGSNEGQPKGQHALSAVSEYFPLSACIEGLTGITKALFGLNIKVSDVSNAESWLRSASTDFNSSFNTGDKNTTNPLLFGYSTGAIKCEVNDLNGDSVGVIYLDLYQRQNKFPGAAHFTLRCGCSNSINTDKDWSSSSGGWSNRSSSNEWKSNTEEGKYQLPIVAISFNFSSPIKSANSFSNNDSRQVLLTLNDVETLHHEW
jgi:intermediate peptidase